MKGATLVVLAAGMGSRYGGLKQMDRLGKNGEVLLDYSVYDAVRSGFEKVVFIVRRDIEKDFRETVLARMESKVRCELAFQEMDSLIPTDIFAQAQKAERTKPWGTTHALLCAAGKIDGPFAVINADDFYGREAFAVLGKHLSGPDGNDPVIVPYRLDKTLSSQGTVARGVCKVSDGYLVSVEELTAIERKDGEIMDTAPDGSIRKLADDSPVSMNFWGFPTTLLPEFRKYFDEFLATFAADIPGQIKSECFIPRAADWFIGKGITKIKALKADSDWFGVTYREDREAAIKKLSDLTQAGVYPEQLWG
ncbi:MAG: hypothetical protein FWB78_01620 [Treponema sp.]|nr:hypothetical protein [Treponema sp.]MCL2192078.1 hypothetical protein [Treponema sp.]